MFRTFVTFPANCNVHLLSIIAICDFSFHSLIYRKSVSERLDPRKVFLSVSSGV
jgi:hypothetical protein